MQSRLDAQLFLSMVKQSSTHIHHPLSITISLDHHHNLYQVSQHNLPLIIIDFTSPYFPIVCSAAWSWNIRIGRIWSRWYDITFDSLRLCAGSNMRDEIKSILNLFRQILNTLIVRNGNMWLNLNSWREPGLYGSATHCYLVSTRTRRLDKQDYDDNDGRYMVLMKMILKNMRMMTEGGLKMTTKMLNNSWWQDDRMATVRRDHHGLPIVIKIHLEATEVKNHLKFSPLLNIEQCKVRSISIWYTSIDIMIKWHLKHW